MAVPEAEQYLPKERGVSHAFDKANRWYSTANTLDTLKALPSQRIERIAADYVTTSVAYFANRTGDNLLEEIGTTAWHAINQRRALIAYCEDSRIGAMQVGLPSQLALTLRPDEPSLIVMGNRQGQVVGETATAFLRTS